MSWGGEVQFASAITQTVEIPHNQGYPGIPGSKSQRKERQQLSIFSRGSIKIQGERLCTIMESVMGRWRGDVLFRKRLEAVTVEQ